MNKTTITTKGNAPFVGEGSIKRTAKRVIQGQGLIIAFLLLLACFSFFSEHFLSFMNIRLVLRQVSVLGVIACGMTVVLIGGNLDLSVGSIVSLTAFVTADLVNILGPISAVIAVLLLGMLIGMVNGYLVGFLKLNSLIITLGMLSVLQATVFIYSKGMFVVVKNATTSPFRYLGRGFVWGIPVPVFAWGIVLLISYIILNRTVFGKYIYAMGGNTKAAWFSGIRTDWLTFSTFLISSLTATLGGIMFASRNMAAQNTVGKEMEFAVIAAVALGGTSIFGGSGHVMRSAIGVLIFGFLSNVFILLGLHHSASKIALWIILIAAVWLDISAKRGAK